MGTVPGSLFGATPKQIIIPLIGVWIRQVLLAGSCLGNYIGRLRSIEQWSLGRVAHWIKLILREPELVEQFNPAGRQESWHLCF